MKAKKIFSLFVICIVIGIALVIAGYSMGGDIRSIYISKKGISVEQNDNDPDDVKPKDEQEETVSAGANNVTKKDELPAFSSMDIKLNYANFMIIPSDHYGIEYCMPGVSIPKYEVKNGTLYVESSAYKNDNWQIRLFGFQNREESVTPNSVNIYIPRGMEGDKLSVFLSSGKISIDSANFKKMKLENSFGDLEFGRIKSENLEVDVKSGSIIGEEIDSQKAELNLNFGRSDISSVKSDDLEMDVRMGSLNVDSILGGTADVLCSFGELVINSVSSKELYANNSFGEIDISGISADTIDANVSFGEIKVELNNIDEYNMDCKADFGDVVINNQSKGGSYTLADSAKKKKLKAKCSFGEIEVR